METLRERLTHLSSLVAGAILQGTSALVLHDTSLARQVSSNDTQLNKVRFAIEETTYAMLESRHLNEREVRLAVSTVMVSQALEQIGDNAANIAHLALRLGTNGEETPKAVCDELDEMARTAAEMVDTAVKSFVGADARLAEATVRRDRELNDAYERVSSVVTPGPQSAERRLLLLWVAHNLQQIGSYASAICERAIFVATGELKEFR